MTRPVLNQPLMELVTSYSRSGAVPVPVRYFDKSFSFIHTYHTSKCIVDKIKLVCSEIIFHSDLSYMLIVT